MIGDPLRVVAGRGCDDPGRLFRIGQARKLVQRAALLEGGGELQVLELDQDFSASDLRQGARFAQRRTLDLPFQDACGIADIVQAYRQLFAHRARVLS